MNLPSNYNLIKRYANYVRVVNKDTGEYRDLPVSKLHTLAQEKELKFSPGDKVRKVYEYQGRRFVFPEIREILRPSREQGKDWVITGVYGPECSVTEEELELVE